VLKRGVLKKFGKVLMQKEKAVTMCIVRPKLFTWLAANCRARYSTSVVALGLRPLLPAAMWEGTN